MRIIGCGTADRGDDAAGLLVVRRLRELGLDACEQSGEGLALIESWTGCDAAIIIDAVVTGRPLGSLTVWHASDAPVVADFCRCSTHAFGVAEAINCKTSACAETIFLVFSSKSSLCSAINFKTSPKFCNSLPSPKNPSRTKT